MALLPLRGILVTAAVAILAGAAPPSSHAQVLPSSPVVLGNGRVTVGGDVSATFSCANDPDGSRCGADTGFFNTSDYEHTITRLMRIDISASVRATSRLSALAEVRSENGSRPRPYALYLRIRPWERRDFDVQVGRVPPTVGAFPRRTYASDNVLIGYPLAYQYLTSLRPDAVPANADELLRMRGRGWLSNFSVGNTAPDAGVPLDTAFRWDTGVQAHAASSWIEGAASVTAGSLASPLLSEDKPGRQMSGRVAVRPMPGLLAGVSASRGPFLTRSALRSAGAAGREGDFQQTAMGADVEYSRDHYIVRVESLHSTWTLPTIGVPLSATATEVEGRYKITARLHAAARVDHLGFSTIAGATRTDSWDAPVTRTEVGGGYLLQRNLQLKFSVQRNVRQGGRVPRLTLGVVQLVFWM